MIRPLRPPAPDAQQLGLFGRPRPVESKPADYPPQLYRGAPPHVAQDTSRAASEAIKPEANTLRAAVLAYVAGRGDATVDEAEAALGMLHQSCGARFRELVLLGHLVDSGRRRPTRNGRQAIVWAPK